MLSTSRSVLYALGATGYGIVDRLVMVLLLYFYLPPPGRDLPSQVPLEPFWGVATAFGLAMGLGRIVDAVADPIVGYASDRSRSPRGRRRVFMLYAVVPMVAFSVVAFWPPAPPGSVANAIFLGVVLSLFFAAFTGYVAPLLALLPEIEDDPLRRLRLASFLGAAGLVAVLGFAPAAFAALDALRTHAAWSASGAVRAVALVSGALALVLCVLPLVAVDERSTGEPKRSELGLVRAIRETLAQPAFLLFMAAQALLVMAVSLVAPLPVYLATVILGRTEGFAALLSLPLLLGTVLGFAAVRRAAKVYGAKRAMVAACLVAVPGFAAWGWLWPAAPGTPGDQLNLAVALSSAVGAGLAVAGFAIIPYLLISQLIDADAARTGSSRAAMFFGMQGLLLKWVYGIAAALLAFLFGRFGNSAEEPLGVLLVGPLAALCFALAAAGFALYPERSVLAHARPRV